jgi:hypothetical protein
MSVPESSISTCGNSANTAADINIATQQNTIGGSAKKLELAKQEWTGFNNCTTNNTTNINQTGMVTLNLPENIYPEIVFRALDPPEDCCWNEGAKKFTTKDEAIRDQEQR